MQPLKQQSPKALELERLRRELLRRIVANEARRQVARAAMPK